MSLAKEMYNKASLVLETKKSARDKAIRDLIEESNILERLKTEIDEAASEGEYRLIFNYRWWEEEETNYFPECLKDKNGNLNTGYLDIGTLGVLQAWVKENGFECKSTKMNIGRSIFDVLSVIWIYAHK